MVVRFYLMPKTQQTIRNRTAAFPKYFTEIEADGAQWAGVDWPGWYLIRVDGSNALHTTLNAFPDTTRAPADLSSTVSGGQLAPTIAALETSGLPADWVTVGTTWRLVLRGMAEMAQLWQRIKETNLLSGGRTLSTTWSALPANIRTKILSAATSFEQQYGITLNRSSLSGSSTLRQILRAVGSQLAFKISLGGEEL